jgi:hypothetical protein
MPSERKRILSRTQITSNAIGFAGYSSRRSSCHADYVVIYSHQGKLICKQHASSFCGCNSQAVGDEGGESLLEWHDALTRSNRITRFLPSFTTRSLVYSSFVRYKKIRCLVNTFAICTVMSNSRSNRGSPGKEKVVQAAQAVGS